LSRYRAALYHFGISLVVFVFLAYLVLVVWFPAFFYAIDGGWEGMRIIIGVDLVLGPTLTLIVFKVGKPGLKLDLTLIGLFQSICLAAGVYVVYSERPLFFIYYDKHFYSASADTFTRYGRPVPDLPEYSEKLPIEIFIELPESPIEEADLRRILTQDRIPAWIYEPLFTPLAASMDEVLTGGIELEELKDRDTNDNLTSWLEKYGGAAADYVFIPIHSRYRDAFIALSPHDGQFVDIVEIRPPL
jgi:hypothetical protein|tara:strand:- start:2173 stop:2907 length:735 start_codon:yes stop_codon:yes gene_type:complete